jgi:hypothetical protein
VVGHRFDGERAHLGARLLPVLGEIVVQAAELDGPADLRVHDLGAHAALAHQHPALDQVLDGPPHRGPGDTQPIGQLDLVLEAAAGGQLPLIDELLHARGDLVVERYRARAVQDDIGHQHARPPNRLCQDKVLTR